MKITGGGTMKTSGSHRTVAASALLGLALMAFANLPAAAGQADVVAVEAIPENWNIWRFTVTVRHDDEGWDHYADQWDVVGPDGTVYGSRVLAHPHENEQPFTRSLSGVEIPEGVTQVTIRARDSVHGYGGAEMTIRLSR